MTLRQGDVIELAVWLAGDETAEHLRQFMAEDAPAALKAKAGKDKALIGETRFEIKKPGDERAGPVPAWLEKRLMSMGRKAVLLSLKPNEPGEHYVAPILLVATAMVIGRKSTLKPRGFVDDLSPKDRADLRKRTKEVWDRAGVGYRPLTDQEADKLIDEHGPTAAYDAVLRVLDGGKARH